MNELYTALIVPIVGILFGWFCNETSRRFKESKDDLKIQNRVLFNLLEVRNLLIKLPIDDGMSSLMMKMMKNKLPKETPVETIQKEMVPFFNGFVLNFIENELKKDFKRIESDFDESLKDLSLIDPILAYRLRGKNLIMDILASLNSYYEGVKENLELDPNDLVEVDHILELVKSTIKPDVVSEMISQLNSIILILSKKAGRKALKESKEILSRKILEDNDVEEKINKLIDKIISDKKNYSAQQRNPEDHP